MRFRRLKPAFFDRSTLLVARDLIGTVMISHIGGRRVGGRVVECEAYPRGDSTAHSARGITPRCASMFAEPGTLYVYFTYGMHHCANIVTESVGVGTAVLVRALEPIFGIVVMRERRGAHVALEALCRGPACLCCALGIDRSLDGLRTTAHAASVYFAEDARPDRAPPRVARSARVGVVGTSEDVHAPWRFFEHGHKSVSRASPGRVVPAREAITRLRAKSGRDRA